MHQESESYQEKNPFPGETVEVFNLKKPFPLHLGRKAKGGVLAGTFMLASGIAGGQLHWAMDNKGTIANLSREIIGFENTQWIEHQYLTFNDYKNRKMFQLGFGPEEKPFDTPVNIITNPPEEEIIEVPPYLPPSLASTELIPGESFPLPEAPQKKLRPFILPDTHILISNPLPGEGSWSIDGLPTTKEELTMAKTFIRPDAKRPYSNVGVIVFDSRRVNLNMVGGAFLRGNGGDKGPGKVPDQDLSNLLAVMNGGFQLDHARQQFNPNLPFVWGAYLDGVEYATLQPGMGSVAVFKDGTVKMGVWGEGDLTQRTEDMVSVRQNGPLMIQNGELTPAIKNEGDVFLWGKFKKEDTGGEIITFRSAIGMTKDGNLIFAAANDLSALNFARGLQAAGAYVAFQLDINSSWVQVGVVSGHNHDGSPILSSFMDKINNGNKFLSKQERDLMYITRSDDSRYKPE